MIRLQVLGAADLLSREGIALDAVLAQPKRMALLCYLAVATPRGFHRRDVIKTVFWPEHDAEQARHALRQTLYFLRRAAGSGVIVSRGDELALSAEHFSCDAWDFDRAIGEERYEDAMAIYRGDLLPGLYVSDAPEFERWLDAERGVLRERAATAAWAAADARARAADAAGAAELARRAAGLVPGDETGMRKLLRYLEQLGDRAGAIRAYHTFVQELATEFELEPSAETRLLAERIRNADRPAAELAATPPRPVVDRVVAGADGADDRPEPLRIPGDRGPAGAHRPTVPSLARKIWTSHRMPSLLVLLFLAALGAWWVPQLWPHEHEPERVIVADFSSAQGDTTIGDLVAHLLRSELARSPLLRIAGQSAIDGALRRMRVQPGVRLSAAVAREVAIREEIKVVVAGRADAVGAGVALSASVIEVASGEILYGAIDTAHDRSDSRSLLRAVGRLASAIRRGAGESVVAARAGDTLWSFTTPSTLALARHMTGTRANIRGDYLYAAKQFAEAVTIDPEFAHAYLMLAGMRNRAHLPLGPGLRAIERAYELRGDLTSRERYTIEGNYHLHITGDVHRAVDAFHQHIEAREKGEGAWYRSYAASLIAAGDLARAAKILEESREVYSTGDSRALHTAVLVALGHEREAGTLAERWLEDDPRHPKLRQASARLLALGGDWPRAYAESQRIRRETGLDNDLLTMAAMDAMVGRLDEARSHLLALREQALALSALPAAVEISCAIDQLRLVARDSAAGGETEDLLRRYPIASIDTLSRPYLPLALCDARAGRTRQALAWLDAWKREFPPRLRGPDRWMFHRVRAALYLAEDAPEDAVRELREAARSAPLRAGMFDDAFVSVTDHPDLARAYDRLDATDSAIAVYERYLAARSLNRSVLDAFELAPSLERLAQLYEARGDRRLAAARLRHFVNQWRAADAPLRPRVLDAARRADALERDAP
jgi:DNA-binding SARP family transcriptional activator/tetratricopeptide (TPR) repeat protein